MLLSQFLRFFHSIISRKFRPGGGKEQDGQEYHDSEEMEGDYGPSIARGVDHFPPQSQLWEDDLVTPCSALPVSNKGPATHQSPCPPNHSTKSSPDEKELERHNPEEIEADNHSNPKKLKEDGPAPRCSTIPEWNEDPAMNNSPRSAPRPLIYPIGDSLGWEQKLTAEESQEGGSVARCPRQSQILVQSRNTHRLIAQGPDNSPMAEHLALGHDSSTPIPESIALWFINRAPFPDFAVGGNRSLMNLSGRNLELDATKTAAIHLHAYGENAFLPFLVALQHQFEVLLATWKRRCQGIAIVALWWSQFKTRLAVVIKSKLSIPGITLLQLQPLLLKLRQSSEASAAACLEFALSLMAHKVKFCAVLGLLFGGFLMFAWPRQEKPPEWSIGEGYKVAMDIYRDNVAPF